MIGKMTLEARAIYLLAQREHSVFELRRKLTKAEFEEAEIENVLQQLIETNLQSDRRYTEAYINSRSNRGFGWQRIRRELTQRGVDGDDINAVIPTLEIDWFALAIAARHKRFGEQRPDDFKERAKQQRFLYYRGFTHEQINESFNTI